MSMRSVWKGTIQFSLMSIPVKVYSAVDSGEGVKFSNIHTGCNGNVGHKKYCKKCNTDLQTDMISRAYEWSKEQFVVITDEDLEQVKLKSTKTVEVKGFIDSLEFDLMLIEQQYYVSPDGDAGQQPYTVLLEALKKSNRIALGTIVFRDREQPVAIEAKGDCLVLHKLRFQKEVRKIENVPNLKTITVNPQLVDLASTLIDSMQVKMKDVKFEDRYGDAVRELVQAKVDGKEVVSSKEEVAPQVDMMDLLKQSIDILKSTKTTKKKGKAA